MNVAAYIIAAYVIGLGLLWGYALSLWLTYRRLHKQQASKGRDES